MLLKGASKEEAFRVGREITERVIAANPKPVKLRFEKARPRLGLSRYCTKPFVLNVHSGLLSKSPHSHALSNWTE